MSRGNSLSQRTVETELFNSFKGVDESKGVKGYCILNSGAGSQG